MPLNPRYSTAEQVGETAYSIVCVGYYQRLLRRHQEAQGIPQNNAYGLYQALVQMFGKDTPAALGSIGKAVRTGDWSNISTVSGLDMTPEMRLKVRAMMEANSELFADYSARAMSSGTLGFLQYRAGAAAMALWSDMFMWVNTPGALCCLIKILIANLADDPGRFRASDTVQKHMANMREWSVLLRSIADIIEKYKTDYMAYLKDILSGLGAAITRGLMNALCVLRDGVMQHISSEVIQPLLDRIKSSDCLPAHRLAEVFINVFMSPSGIMSHIMKLIANLWNAQSKDAKKQMDTAGVQAIVRILRMLATLLDSISSLLEMGVICVPGRETSPIPVPEGITPEVPEGYDLMEGEGTVGEDFSIDSIEVIDAVLKDAVAMAGDVTGPPRSSTQSSFTYIEDIPRLIRKEDIPLVGNLEYTDSYVHPEDISAVLQDAFGYSADIANKAAHTSVREGCARAIATLSRADSAELRNIKATWDI